MAFSVGNIVHITHADSPKYAGTYTVVKTNPTTYRLQRDGDGGFLKAHHGLVHAGPLVKGDANLVTELPISSFQPGTVVTVKARGIDPDAYYVVTGQVARGYRIFPLGGSPRYYTGVAASALTRVERIENWSA